MDAIVLAGGRGTRMGHLTATTPKPMLPVAGAPLIAHLIRRLHRAGVTRVVLATGYRAEAFDDLASFLPRGLTVVTSREDHPLGTGGGLALALQALASPQEEPVIVVNGDLLTSHSLQGQLQCFDAADASLVVHVRTVPDPGSYGEVTCNEFDQVVSFREKPQQPTSNLVNAGTYVVSRRALRDVSASEPSSLERDVIPALVSVGEVMAYRETGYFRDVGTPEALAAVAGDEAEGRIPDGVLFAFDSADSRGGSQ